MTNAFLAGLAWPERLCLAALALWALCVWMPAWTHTLWFAGLIARETAHVGALLAIALCLYLLWAHGHGASAPAALLTLPLLWPLAATVANPRSRPDFTGWPGRAQAAPASFASALRQAPGLAPASVEMHTHRFREDPVELHLDHYRLAGAGRAPRAWLMVVHGGAWRSGSRKEHAGFNRAFAALGVDVLAVDYRLAPTWRYPHPLEDLVAALAWVRAKADSLGLDPTAGHVLGRSAGGQLALQLAYGEAGQGLRLAIALYAPADMVHAGTAPFNRRVLDARAVLQDYLGSSWAEDAARYEAASPLLAVDRGDLPPTLLLHGPDDAMVAFEHTRRLASALRKQGVPVATAVLPWMQHGGDVVGVGPSAWFVFRAVVAAVGRVSPRSDAGER